MLAAWVKREEIKYAREQGRAIEREAWRNWYRELEAWESKKAAAESKGEDFDEPRPAPPGED